MVIARKAQRGRTPTGALVFVARHKKNYESGNKPLLTRVESERKTVVRRSRGGAMKTQLATANEANVYDPKKKMFVKAKIEVVAQNLSNRIFVRRNVITKGAILQTSAGKAKVTNRPSQEGHINAILVD